MLLDIVKGRNGALELIVAVVDRVDSLLSRYLTLCTGHVGAFPPAGMNSEEGLWEVWWMSMLVCICKTVEQCSVLRSVGQSWQLHTTGHAILV